MVESLVADHNEASGTANSHSHHQDGKHNLHRHGNGLLCLKSSWDCSERKTAVLETNPLGTEAINGIEINRMQLN